MTSAAWEAARARYSNPGKDKARMVPVRIAEKLPRGARYLELSGGGLSAEAVRAVRPDLEMVSADIDRELWPDLLEHARRFDYHALCGSFDKAEGLFDLIYLDLTGNSADSTSIRLVRRAVEMLSSDGWLVVTITPDHELDSAVSLNRPVAVAGLLMEATRRQLVGALRYPNGDGKRVVLCVFRGNARTLDAIALHDALERRALYPYWARLGTADVFGTPGSRTRATPDGRRRHNERSARYHAKPEVAERRREQNRRRRSTPEYRAKNAEYQRQRRVEKGDEVRAKDRERYATTESRRRAIARARAKSYDQHGAEQRERQRARYANDIDYREYVKERERERYRAKKLAAVSGTAAEAISNEEAA